MRPDETFVGAPVRNLQTMLRYISKQDSSYENVIPDGIYGAQTASAVSTFQRRHNLPITGVADLNTWEAIQQAYAPARVQIDNAYPLQIILNPNQVIRRGEADPNIHIVQAILFVLSQEYGSILEPSRSGMVDDATAASIGSFQELNGLPVTGELDKLTWRELAIHYPLASNRNRDYRNFDLNLE